MFGEIQLILGVVIFREMTWTFFHYSPSTCLCRSHPLGAQKNELKKSEHTNVWWFGPNTDISQIEFCVGTLLQSEGDTITQIEQNVHLFSQIKIILINDIFCVNASKHVSVHFLPCKNSLKLSATSAILVSKRSAHSEQCCICFWYS